MSNLFSSVIPTTGMTAASFAICLITALAMGFGISWVYTKNSNYSKSFAETLAVVPAVVAIIIMMVSGNIGAGIAIAGTFSLVRFRSIPGTAREICGIFLVMADGLLCGMGYVAYAVVFAAVMALVTYLYARSGFGAKSQSDAQKRLVITVPEDLEYDTMFEDVFAEYTEEHKLVKVKTTNLGSLNKLTYLVTLKDPHQEKAMIDEMRIRNGNLEINSSLQSLYEGETL